MAQRFRIDWWYLEIWNGTGWNREGPYEEDHIDAVFGAQRRVMPNCPCRIIGEVLVESYDGMPECRRITDSGAG